MSNATAEDMPAAYSPRDFARVYGIGLTLTYELIGAGKLKARKLGRRTMILREDAEHWARSLPTL